MDATDRKIIAELEAEGRLTVTALAQQVNRVATADLAAYQNLRDEKLATLPGVQRLTSTILMKRVVDERPSIVSPPLLPDARQPLHEQARSLQRTQDVNARRRYPWRGRAVLAGLGAVR